MNLDELTRRAAVLRSHFSEIARAKGAQDWTREDVMQGFVGDVGDLMKLTMAKRGVREVGDADNKLAHELADCLWSVLTLAEMYGVDIEKEFVRMVDDVSRRQADEKKLPNKSPQRNASATSVSTMKSQVRHG